MNRYEIDFNDGEYTHTMYVNAFNLKWYDKDDSIEFEVDNIVFGLEFMDLVEIRKNRKSIFKFKR